MVLKIISTVSPSAFFFSFCSFVYLKLSFFFLSKYSFEYFLFIRLFPKILFLQPSDVQTSFIIYVIAVEPRLCIVQLLVMQQLQSYEHIFGFHTCSKSDRILQDASLQTFVQCCFW